MASKHTIRRSRSGTGAGRRSKPKHHGNVAKPETGTQRFFRNVRDNVDALYGRDAASAADKLRDAIGLVRYAAPRTRVEDREAFLQFVRKAITRLQEVEGQLAVAAYR
jgi:hypothetical protein